MHTSISGQAIGLHFKPSLLGNARSIIGSCADTCELYYVKLAYEEVNTQTKGFSHSSFESIYYDWQFSE